MRSRKNRGYWVSRQAYAHGEPCLLAVEIAYSTDSSTPQENASADALADEYLPEGYHDYPVEAVEAAKRVLDMWYKDFPSLVGKAEIQFTVVTGGGMISPEIMTLEELEAWAAKRYNGLPERDESTGIGRPRPEQQAIIDRFRHLEDERVRLLIEPDELPYDDSYFDSWDVCEEELEELKDDCARTIEREGVWHIQPQFLRKGVWEDAGYGCCGYLGPIEWVDTIEHMAEALDAYDAYVNEKNEKAARKLARRATYAGPTQE